MKRRSDLRTERFGKCRKINVRNEIADVFCETSRNTDPVGGVHGPVHEIRDGLAHCCAVKRAEKAVKRFQDDCPFPGQDHTEISPVHTSNNVV